MILFISRTAELKFNNAQKASGLDLKLCIIFDVSLEAGAAMVHEHGCPNTPSPFQMQPSTQAAISSTVK